MRRRASWDNFHERFEIKGISYQKAYSLYCSRDNLAEEYSS